MSAPPLIVRCGAFGDMVLLTPLIRLLAARYGTPVDLLGAGAWTLPLLRGMPELGQVRILTSRNAPYALWPNQWAAVRWLRQRGRGPVYLCDAGEKIRRLLARAGVPAGDVVDGLAVHYEAQGEVLWPDHWLQVGMRDPANAMPTRPITDPSAYRLPRLPVDPAQREAVRQWRRAQCGDGPLVLLQPGNKRTHKRGRLGTLSQNKFWPPERWAQVARAVLEERPDARVVLCGSPAEHAVLEDIRRLCADPRVLNLARELPVARLVAMLEQAHGMVSVDTGPAHAAAAVGCPLVVLFGAAPVSLWRPIGPAPVRVLGGARGAASRVEDIGTDAVVAAWRSLPRRT